MPGIITDAAGLLAAAALKTTAVTIRGATLTIRELSIAGREAFLAGHQSSPAAAALAVLLHGVINPDTKAPLLTQEQAEALADSSADFVQELAGAILKVSGLAEDDAGNAQG